MWSRSVGIWSRSLHAYILGSPYRVWTRNGSNINRDGDVPFLLQIIFQKQNVERGIFGWCQSWKCSKLWFWNDRAWVMGTKLGQFTIWIVFMKNWYYHEENLSMFIAQLFRRSISNTDLYCCSDRLQIPLCCHTLSTNRVCSGNFVLSPHLIHQTDISTCCR